MSRAAPVFPAVILVAVAAFAAGGHFLGEYTWNVIAFPLGAALLTCALCAIEIARGLAQRPQSAPAAAAAPPADGDDTPLPISVAGLAWMFVLPVFLYGLGFVAGPAVYLLACLRANGFSWTLAVVIAACSVAMTYGLFIHVMGVLLPVMPLWWP
jgi:hypothetical protein